MNIKSILAVFCVCVFTLGMVSSANAATYNFSLDHFRVVGNLPGDIADDFNDGSLDPLWRIYDPTIVESGSTVSFSSPGTIGALQFGTLSIIYEMSYMGSTGLLQMQNGSGDFQGTSTWTASVPGLNQFYTMGIDINDFLLEEVSITVYNMDSDIANALGSAPGLGVSFGSGFDSQNISIVPSDITGDILLRLAFDDATDMFSGAYSLDGGTTFLNPFTAIAPNSGVQALGWYLGAESWTVVPIPAAVWLFGSGLICLVGMARRKARA